MIAIYYLQHTIQYHNRSHDKGIGAFHDVAEARKAIEMLRGKPGFRSPNGAFSIFKCELDRSYPTSGLDASNNLVAETDSAFEQARPGQVIHYAYWDDPERDNDTILIGYFSSRQLAEAALKDAKTWLPDLTRGELDVSISVVDRVNWLEGFGPAD